jgi:hypothetical protein
MEHTSPLRLEKLGEWFALIRVRVALVLQEREAESEGLGYLCVW